MRAEKPNMYSARQKRCQEKVRRGLGSIEWLRSRYETSFRQLSQLFEAVPCNPELMQRRVVQELCFYETSKANAGVVLSSKIFKEHNARLSGQGGSVLIRRQRIALTSVRLLANHLQPLGETVGTHRVDLDPVQSSPTSVFAIGLLPMTPSSLELLRGLEQSLTAPLRRRPGRELSLLAITSSGEVRSAASAARPGGNACPRRLERARPAAGTCRSR